MTNTLPKTYKRMLSQMLDDYFVIDVLEAIAELGDNYLAPEQITLLHKQAKEHTKYPQNNGG